MKTFKIKYLLRAWWLLLILVGIILGPAVAYAEEIQMGYEGNLVFNPNELTISVGDTVKFVNNDLPPHNVVFVNGHENLSQPDLNFIKGDTVEVTFDEAGIYEYQCEPHAGAGMKGVIHVE
tara:strand:- start:340 stop:702 length:363 start_codon:yes stop_codon:yes gene_type:complete